MCSAIGSLITFESALRGRWERVVILVDRRVPWQRFERHSSPQAPVTQMAATRVGCCHVTGGCQGHAGAARIVASFASDMAGV